MGDFTSGGQGERTARLAEGVDHAVDGLGLPEFGKN
tara:strand:+ start:1056 stop:1163 length:108 start_codon:yes stop_codon:yes gene_type:complete